MESAAKTSGWTDEWAVGSMVSAALAANEAFKFVIRRLPLRHESTQVFFEQSPCCSWNFGSISVPEKEIDLGDVDVISAGAISQAALYALMRLPNLRMRGRIFAEDTTAASNLNRNMLTLVTDIGSPKVQVVAQRCGAKLQLQPVHTRFVGESFEGTLANRVLVGVDDIPSRWEVQRHARAVGLRLAVQATLTFHHRPTTQANPALAVCTPWMILLEEIHSRPFHLFLFGLDWRWQFDYSARW